VDFGDVSLAALVFYFSHLLRVYHASQYQIQILLGDLKSSELLFSELEIDEFPNALLVEGRSVHALATLEVDFLVEFLSEEFADVSKQVFENDILPCVLTTLRVFALFHVCGNLGLFLGIIKGRGQERVALGSTSQWFWGDTLQLLIAATLRHVTATHT